MRQYELTYLISDKVSESDLNKVTGKIGGLVTKAKGKLLKEEIWKRRKLAYPIKKQEFATYVTINFDLPADKTAELERQLRLTNDVIRHLLIVRGLGDEALTLTVDEIAGTEAIEEAAGGDRAFEAVEGETEESRDLMSVRAKSEEEEAEENKEAQEEEEAEESAPASDEAKETASEKKEETKAEDAKADGEKKTPRKRAAKKAPENEADRLAKLDEQLDELLKDDL